MISILSFAYEPSCAGTDRCMHACLLSDGEGFVRPVCRAGDDGREGEYAEDGRGQGERSQEGSRGRC